MKKIETDKPRHMWSAALPPPLRRPPPPTPARRARRGRQSLFVTRLEDSGLEGVADQEAELAALHRRQESRAVPRAHAVHLEGRRVR